MNNEVVINKKTDIEVIKNHIYEIRGQLVILDYDLAKFYDVSTGYLRKIVDRNSNRFPNDFLFSLTADELRSVKSLIKAAEILSQKKITPSPKRYGNALPFAFTEHGALTLATLLRKYLAAPMGAAITRAFINMRDTRSGLHSFRHKVEELSNKVAALNNVFEEALNVESFDIDTHMQVGRINDAVCQLQQEVDK